MKVLKISACYAFVMLLSSGFLYSLNSAVDIPAGSRPRVLFISDCSSEYWQRSVAGARDAAQQLGLELQVAMPSQSSAADEQSIAIQNFNPAAFDAVAIAPVDGASQLDAINALTHRTKLVTLGNDSENSKPLCRVSSAAFTDGHIVARLVHQAIADHGTVVLLNTKTGDEVATSTVAQRRMGFKDEWPQSNDATHSTTGAIVEVELDSGKPAEANNYLMKTLSDSDLAVVVAMDAQSAEMALATQSSLPTTKRPMIIAFESNVAVFNAIADGRIHSAIFHDPYRAAFSAIERLDVYCQVDNDALPVLGRGNCLLIGEVVNKDNLAEVRRRLQSDQSI